MAGKSLKRKIEQSLRFGKPLDKFQGMEKLFKKLGDQNPNISQIWIEATDGKSLYNWTRNILKNDINHTHEKILFDKNGENRTILTNGYYIIYIPLKNISQNIAGTLCISFPQKIIYSKVKAMVMSNLNILWTSVMVTSFGLIFVLAILIFKPLKKEIAEISDIFDKNRQKNGFFEKKDGFDKKIDEKTQKTTLLNKKDQVQDSYTPGFDIHKIKGEIELLKVYISSFLEKSDDCLASAQKLMEEQQKIFQLHDRLKQCELELVHAANKDQCHYNEEEKQLFNKIIEESKHTRVIISLMHDFCKGLEISCLEKDFTNLSCQK